MKQIRIIEGEKQDVYSFVLQPLTLSRILCHVGTITICVDRMSTQRWVTIGRRNYLRRSLCCLIKVPLQMVEPRLQVSKRLLNQAISYAASLRCREQISRTTGIERQMTVPTDNTLGDTRPPLQGTT
ncbi:hypothetical protein AMTR_s00015p00211640 [Amborella trichopoda]|uniref:Uncharacterized protein n=1 Tax=Amborella trichopoda TaxID=13333 RepID=W1PFW3_AMBTC|nr:hypothetical protein AMTR_s00015p00211640 [Amborella trichopoda]